MPDGNLKEASAGITRPIPGCVIIGDVLLFRDGLASGLRKLDDVSVLGCFTSDQAGEAIHEASPDVVIVDITHSDILTTMQSLICAQPDLPFVGFGIGGQSDTIRCAEAGISAFVGQDETIEDLNRAVLKAVKGEAVCSPRMTARLIRHLATLTGNSHQRISNCLTAREREVASLVKLGQSNKEIARQLGISPATVKNHVHMILEKLHMSRRSSIGQYI